MSPLARVTPPMRAAALAAGSVVLCWPLTGAAGVVAGAAGTAAGATLATRVAGSRLRTATGAVLALAAALVGRLVAGLVVQWVWVSEALGPIGARSLGEVVLWAVLGAAVGFALRLLSERVPTLAVLELAVVAAAVAVALAAHRGGMIHRPFALADWAFSRGLDPMKVLLAIGGATAIGAALLVFREPRRRRWPVHALGLAIVASIVALAVARVGLPEPQTARELGLTGEPQEEGGEGRDEREEQRERQRERRRPSVASGAEPAEPSRPEGMSPDELRNASGQGTDQDELQFLDEYSAAGGEAPVAVVVFHDDYEPPAGVYYLRQTAFSQFNGRRLVQSASRDVDRDVVELFPVARTEVAGAPPDGPGRRALETTVGLIAEHQKPFALDTPVALWPVSNPDPLRFRRAYAVTSRVPTAPYRELLGRRAGLPGWERDEWAHYMAGPDHDPRYAALASQILSSLPDQHRDDPLARAFAVKVWLEENGIYSRRSRHAGAYDPTASFLFGDRVGYCVHFAHASVFLLRALGVPSRVAAGYAVEEARRAGGSALMVRGLDAHAWPEIALEGVGWVVVDISPKQTLDPPADSPDRSLQQMLGEALRRGPPDPLQPDGGRRWPELASILRAAGLALVALSVVAFVVKLYRAWAPGLAGAAHVHRVAYRAALDRLSEIGLRRAEGETREAFAARAAASSRAFGALTHLHLAWAHGSRRVLDPAASRRLYRDVASEARGAVPRWRWLLGALNPVSYLGSR